MKQKDCEGTGSPGQLLQSTNVDETSASDSSEYMLGSSKHYFPVCEWQLVMFLIFQLLRLH